MSFRIEREKRETSIRETWREVQRQAQREKRWVRQALERGNRECFKLLEPEPPPLISLGLEESVEWQIFYLFLLGRLVRTDEELEKIPDTDLDLRKKVGEYVASITYPVMDGLLEELASLKGRKVKDWFREIDSAAQFIVIECRRNVSEGERYYQVRQQAERFGKKLKEIYEAPD